MQVAKLNTKLIKLLTHYDGVIASYELRETVEESELEGPRLPYVNTTVKSK